jgi:hypothetical protein
MYFNHNEYKNPQDEDEQYDEEDGFLASKTPSGTKIYTPDTNP